MFDQGIAVFFR